MNHISCASISVEIAINILDVRRRGGYVLMLLIRFARRADIISSLPTAFHTHSH